MDDGGDFFAGFGFGPGLAIHRWEEFSVNAEFYTIPIPADLAGGFLFASMGGKVLTTMDGKPLER